MASIYFPTCNLINCGTSSARNRRTSFPASSIDLGLMSPSFFSDTIFTPLQSHYAGKNKRNNMHTTLRIVLKQRWLTQQHSYHKGIFHEKSLNFNASQECIHHKQIRYITKFPEDPSIQYG